MIINQPVLATSIGGNYQNKSNRRKPRRPDYKHENKLTKQQNNVITPTTLAHISRPNNTFEYRLTGLQKHIPASIHLAFPVTSIFPGNIYNHPSGETNFLQSLTTLQNKVMLLFTTYLTSFMMVKDYRPTPANKNCFCKTTAQAAVVHLTSPSLLYDVTNHRCENTIGLYDTTLPPIDGVKPRLA